MGFVFVAAKLLIIYITICINRTIVRHKHTKKPLITLLCYRLHGWIYAYVYLFFVKKYLNKTVLGKVAKEKLKF